MPGEPSAPGAPPCGGVGLPLSNALPCAGVGLPAGDVPGLPGGVALGGSVARGDTPGEVIPRGVAAGEPAPPGFAGEAGGAPAPPGVPDGGLPAPRAAALVGGGTFFGFSVLIFCFSCASLGTPAQPRLIFGCATLVFTAGGLAPGGALVSLFGAATTSLFPCTFVSAPDLAAAEILAADCRSILSR